MSTPARALAPGLTVCSAVLFSLILGCEPVEHPAPETPKELLKPITSVKLPDREKTTASRFELLTTDRSGVDFRFTWNPESIHPSNGLGTTGAAAGVCLGDYDQDGLPDIFLTRPFGGNRLYRNLGDFRFEDVTQSAGLTLELEHEAWGAGPCFVDIDNDGDLDLYVCSHRRSNRLYISQGDGTFTEQAKSWGLDYNGASVTMAFCDYDNDGDLDAYLVTNRLIRDEQMKGNRRLNPAVRAGRMRVAKEFEQIFDVVNMGPPGSGRYGFAKGAELDHFYRNQGGKFVDATVEVLGEESAAENYFGHSARWFDFNRDGYQDLFVSNDFFGPDQLFMNNGDGTLQDVTRTALPHIAWYSMGSDAADVNNDGLLDLMTADMAFTTHFKSKVNMGDMSASAWFLDYSDPKQQMSNALFVNTGTSRFLEAAGLAGVAKSDWTWAIKFGDLDEDGQIDLYLTNGYTRNWFDSDLRNREKMLGKTNASEQETAAWDTIWKDQPPMREFNLAFRNAGDLQFEKVSQDWGLGFEGASFGSALGDLDGDGDLDIVTVNFEDQTHLYRNNSADNHRIAVQLIGDQSNRSGFGAVVEVETPAGVQVRDLAAARGFMSADQPEVHFGLGKHQRVQRLTIYWPSGLVQEHTDLSADHRYTVQESKLAQRKGAPEKPDRPNFAPFDQLPQVQHKESNFDDFVEQPLLPNRLSRLGPGVACGDINGDQIDDFYLAGAKGQAGKLLLGKPGKLSIDMTARFVWQATDAEEMAPLFFDADSDGDLDLYVSHGSNEAQLGDRTLQDQLYLNDGTGTFQPAAESVLPEMTFSGGVVVAADFDRDGDLDLFVGGRTTPSAYPDTPRSALLQNDSGKFTDITGQVAAGLAKVGMVTSALWSDTDNDGWLDLIVTCEWGPISVWKNNQGQLSNVTQEVGLEEATGWWNGIAGGDIDHDGDIDYVVTNFGLNTKYHASHHHPAVIYYGDMDDNGQKDIIEAKFIDSQLFPVRGKSCSTNAIPALADKIGTFHEFAGLALNDIYGGDKLATSQRLAANTLESALLLNHQGSFTAVPLPRIAQVSPGFAPLIFDANADGNNDVYLLQNFYSPQRETVRMDSGVSQLMLGDGNGNLRPLRADQQGVLVPGDGKAACLTDVNQDGAPDLLTTQNNGPLLAFKNQFSGTGRYLPIRLSGPPGNPTAIGAKVAMTTSDGHTTTQEIYAGGGYLTQSSATLFWGLAAGQQPSQVSIRWPSGQETKVSVDREAKSLVLPHPELH